MKIRKTGSEAVIEGLNRAGISHAFGIPGTHNIELYDALIDHHEIKTVLITDEQSAGFMADGYFRASGKLAALLLVPGAGLTHALSGIAEAYLDETPMLIVACGMKTDINKRFQLHGIDQLKIAEPVTKKIFHIDDESKIASTLETAAKIAQEIPMGPVLVEIPVQLLMNSYAPQIDIVDNKTKPNVTESNKDWMTDLRNHLFGKKNIGIYLGNIVGVSQESIIELAEHLDASVWTTMSAKGLFPENNPRFIWNIVGEAAPSEFHAHEKKIDLWLTLGARFGEVATGSYGFNPEAPMIHVNLDEKALGVNIPCVQTIQRDAREVIAEIICTTPKKVPQLSEHPIKSDLIKSTHNTLTEKISADSQRSKIRPSLLFQELQKTFGEKAKYVFDSGNGMFLGMEHLRLSRPQCFLAPIDFSCMGFSVPAGIGAAFSTPADQPVIVLSGDGAFLMTGLEIITAVSNRLPIVFAVLRDHKLSQISQFQKSAMVREFLTDVQPYDLESFGKALGVPFFKLSGEKNLARDLTEIRNNGKTGPILVEIPIDYTVTTHFTHGVIKANFNRFPIIDRFSLAFRFIQRKSAERLRSAFMT